MNRLALAVVGSAVLIAGCSDCMSPADYGHAWRQSVLDYRAIEKDPQLVASEAGAGPEADGTALANAAQSISDEIRNIGKSIKDLKAPPEFQILQDDTYLFYRGQADNYLGYANALSEGNADKIQMAADRVDSYAEEQRSKITSDIAALGKDGTTYADAWKDVFRPIPLTTEPQAAPAPVTPDKPKPRRKLRKK